MIDLYLMVYFTLVYFSFLKKKQLLASFHTPVRAPHRITATSILPSRQSSTSFRTAAHAKSGWCNTHRKKALSAYFCMNELTDPHDCLVSSTIDRGGEVCHHSLPESIAKCSTGDYQPQIAMAQSGFLGSDMSKLITIHVYTSIRIMKYAIPLKEMI